MGISGSSHGPLIPRDFFRGDPLTCARELIGCHLVWGNHSGIIVETEAYAAVGDEAAHTFFRKSAREFVEKNDAGTAYVYLNYGVHWMLNVLLKGKENGFVLFRAIEPLTGIDAMKRRRGVEKLTQLCSGPGKLAKAFGITGKHHGMDLCADPRFTFYRAKEKEKVLVETDMRIGITRHAHFPWRFLLVGSPHVSRPVSKKKK